MLYVFHVDMGRMLKFDMNAALSSVENLKEIIERLHGIPAMHIVLLVSGGEMLSPKTLVCSYSAGTDTNPIFMFSTGDEKPQPWPSLVEVDKDGQKDMQTKKYICNVAKNILQEDWNETNYRDLSEKIERCLQLPATYSTVSERAKLAAQLHDLAREEESICAQLVMEQHLQQQGWAAVIANMEDLTDEFRQRSVVFFGTFDNYFERRDEYLELLEKFSNDLDKLAEIPILPGLMENAGDRFRGFDEFLDNDDVFASAQQNMSMIRKSGETKQVPSTSAEELPQDVALSTEQPRGHNLTLLQWISAKKNHARLIAMSNECYAEITAFSEEVLHKFKGDVEHVIKYAEKEDIKEIKGLEERLSGLEKLMFELRQKVKEQKDLSIAFQQNQNRASNLGDASVLPDLCASHRSQLKVMDGNQKVIRDIRRRISRAKDELGSNLEKRLKYITHIENSMSEKDNNLLFFRQSLLRIDRHMSIIQQIHQTPNFYVQAVTEVVRRRIFSGEFVTWASTLANDFFTIHKAEILRRQEFNKCFEGHFLNTLFPGLEDMPPVFTNESPIKFDADLPNLTKNDIETLSTYLPEITSSIHLPDMAAVIEFFASRSGYKNNEEKASSTGKFQTTNTGSATGAIQRPIDIHAHLKDGFESETDTEEFEKVGQSSNERQLRCQTASMATSTTENERETNSISTSTVLLKTNTISTLTDVPEKHTVETLTEENLGTTRLEVEKLKTLLKSMSDVSYQCINGLKKHLQSIKSDAENNKEEMLADITKFTENWNKIKTEYESRQQKTYECLSSEYQKTIADMQNDLISKEEELSILLREKSNTSASNSETVQNLAKQRDNFREEVDKLTKKIEALENNLQKSESEKEKAVNECRENLIHAHKTEIESLRCRFKLMTSMDRSPSDTSLEKIEQRDVIEISCHESILNQIRETFLVEKESAIRAAVEEERMKWMPTTNSPSYETVEFYKGIIEEKDKQLDAMRQRDAIVTSENNQLKLRIQAISSEEESDKIWFKEKLDHLNKDKTRLEQQLNEEKSKRIEMEMSFAIYKGGSSDPSGVRSKLSSSQVSVKQGVSVDSCSKGDTVFIVWSVKHRQFTVVQESPNLYFVHAESLPGLNLTLPDPVEADIPIPYYAIGKVIDKEYCLAKKDTNRYKVTMGTKFYRIKLIPLLKPDILRLQHKRERFESMSSLSSWVSRSTSNQQLIDTSAQTESFSVSHHIAPSGSRRSILDVGASSSATDQDLVDYAGTLDDDGKITVTSIFEGSVETSSPTMDTASPPEEEKILHFFSNAPSTSLGLTDVGLVQQQDFMSSNSTIAASTSENDVGSHDKVSLSTLFTEDDEEPVSLLSERCRYISLSEAEEDEKAVIDNKETALEMDCAMSMNISTSTNTTSTTTTTVSSADPQIPTESASEKDQDDSDEYRSLEFKEDLSFCVPLV